MGNERKQTIKQEIISHLENRKTFKKPGKCPACKGD